MKKILITALVFLSCEAGAQNRFTQFYSSPFLFNPALTGNFDGRARVGGLIRNEVNANNQLFTISNLFTDFKILKSLTPENDRFGFGIAALNEKNMNGGIKTNVLSLSLGYQKALDEDGGDQLGIGFQTSFGNKSIDPPDFILETDLLKWQQAGFTNLQTGAGAQPMSVGYFDLNVGILYAHRINSSDRVSAGVSVLHTNKPSKQLQGGDFTLARQPIAMLSWERSLPDNRKFYSAALLSYMGGNFEEARLGFMYQIALNSIRNQFHFGTWIKKSNLTGNAIVPAIGLMFKELTLNLTYDINLSTKINMQRGAGEISLVYKR